ncbi:MAG: polyprenyl synthetase family protein [Eubacteriaceae bacterium]
MESFEKKLKDRIKAFDLNLKELFQSKIDAPEIITESMQYSLFAGGKRLRPILMIETCQALEGDVEKVLPLAMGMEMIHTYSLIHDDLPAMDNDDLRRGKPTNHIKYGDAIAILAGDGLLNYSVETMLEGAKTFSGEGVISYLKGMEVIMKASGVSGMIGGQVADMLSEGKNITLDEMDYIHLHKTAALLEASVHCGCLIANAEPATKGRLMTYSNHIGLAFQIVDDILDIEGNAKDLGKNVGSDHKNNKSTFVSLYGLEAAKLKVKELEVEALEMLKPIGERTQFLQELAIYICNRRK